MGKFIDLTGQRFGRLVVVGKNPAKTKGGATRWDCVCDCGNTTTVAVGNLTSGNTKSCGCLSREISKNMNHSHPKHGDSQAKDEYHKLYSVWRAMIDRCGNNRAQNYYLYGERGISVCPEWQSYITFKEWAIENGYIPNAGRGKCTLDRIDVDGDYCPDNCRWVGLDVQTNNKRTCVYIEEAGQIYTQKQFADKHGITPDAVAWRRKHNQNLITGEPL